MPRLVLDFLSDEPTDEELLLQLTCGLGEALRDPREELEVFQNAVGISHIYIRRLMKILIERCELPVPLERVDEWIEYHRINECWVVSPELSELHDKLQKLE